jgi:hypothetical protein
MQMREAMSAIMRSVRKMHGLPDGFMTPERNAKFKNKDEQAAEKAALETKLKQHLQSQIKLPPVCTLHCYAARCANLTEPQSMCRSPTREKKDSICVVQDQRPFMHPQAGFVMHSYTHPGCSTGTSGASIECGRAALLSSPIRPAQLHALVHGGGFTLTHASYTLAQYSYMNLLPFAWAI